MSDRHPRNRVLPGILAIGVALVFTNRAETRQVADLVARCQQLDPAAQELCHATAQAAAMTQPRVGFAHIGGNPVTGTFSTIGMRLGTVPRVSLSARTTFVATELPDVRTETPGAPIRFLAPGLALDGTVGVLAGASPLPTVGGVGSVDLMAGIGLVPLPGGRGFVDRMPFAWGAGLRLGIFRESFTLPGVSLSAAFRRTGTVTFGDRELVTRPAYFSFDMSTISLRAGVSRRFFGFGLAAGAGWDRFSSDVSFGVLDPGGTAHRFSVPGYVETRTAYFGNVSWTALVIHFVGEFGWQSGGETLPADPPSVDRADPESGKLFGSLAIRVSI